MKPYLTPRIISRLRFAALTILALAPLGGCAITYPVPTTVDVPGMPNPELAMRESFKQVDAEMAKISGTRLSVGPRAAPPVVPGELDKVIAFEWQGPLDGAVEQLAKTIGYTVSIRTPSNALPLAIAFRDGPLRVYEIFQALGEAAGAQATVLVDPLHHRVEVIHHV